MLQHWKPRAMCSRNLLSHELSKSGDDDDDEGKDDEKSNVQKQENNVMFQ